MVEAMSTAQLLCLALFASNSITLFVYALIVADKNKINSDLKETNAVYNTANYELEQQLRQNRLAYNRLEAQYYRLQDSHSFNGFALPKPAISVKQSG